MTVASPSRSAADAVDFIQQQASLSEWEKLGFTYLVHNSQSFQHDPSDPNRQKFATEWAHSYSLAQISACKQQDPDGTVYRVRGVTQLPISKELMYVVAMDPPYVHKWDPLIKEVVVLKRHGCPAPLIERSEMSTWYGMPGMSYLVHDRDFLVSFVALELPDGCLLLLLHTPPAGEQVEDRGTPRPRTQRGAVGTSGWVLCPLPDGGVEATMLLQIDPRGSIPTVVVNACNLAIPMNLDRIRRLCAKMGQQEVAQALQRFQEIRSAEEQASA